MSSMFFHKIDRLPAKKKEIAVEEKRKRNSEHGLRIMKREIEYFKRYNLSFVIDDFHRPDGKIVERTVPTNLETYTDRINGEEYETGNVEDLDYIDKFKIKFLFPVQARRKFDGEESISISEAIRQAYETRELPNPTIMPKREDYDDISLIDIEKELLSLEKETERENGESEIIRLSKSKIIHLSDTKDTFNVKVKLSEIITGISMSNLPYEAIRNFRNLSLSELLELEDGKYLEAIGLGVDLPIKYIELSDKIIEKLMNIEDNKKK